MNNIIDEIKKEIDNSTSSFVGENAEYISYDRVIAILNKYQTQIQVIADQEDVYKKMWETLKSIYRSKEDMCVEKVYTENLLEDFDMLELEFGIMED